MKLTFLRYWIFDVSFLSNPVMPLVQGTAENCVTQSHAKVRTQSIKDLGLRHSFLHSTLFEVNSLQWWIAMPVRSRSTTSNHRSQGLPLPLYHLVIILECLSIPSGIFLSMSLNQFNRALNILNTHKMQKGLRLCVLIYYWYKKQFPYNQI